MVVLLFQESWWAGINAVWGLLLILVLIGGALIILMSKRREDVQLIETKRADANANLVKTRDAEIVDLTKRCEKAEEELEETTAELRAVIGINIKQLLLWWQEYETKEAHYRKVEQENRILRMQAGIGPNEDVKMLKE